MKRRRQRQNPRTRDRTRDRSRSPKSRTRWYQRIKTSAAVGVAAAGGILTSVLTNGQRALSLGIEPLNSFADTLSATGLSAGSIIGAAFSAIAKIIRLGAIGLKYIADNFWLFATALGVVLVYRAVHF